MTACQSCRTAKVRCDGRKSCARCVARGGVCTYANLDLAGVTPSSDYMVTDETLSGGNSGFDIIGNIHPIPVEDDHSGQIWDNVAGLQNTASQRTMRDLGWGALERDINAITYDLAPNSVPSVPITEMPDFQVELSHDYQDAHNTSTSSLMQSTLEAPTAASIFGPSPVSKSSPCNSLFTSSTCRCRQKLATLAAKAQNATQAKNPDEVHNMIRQVLQSCHDVIECTNCEIGCNDLICMIAVIQKTDVCFDFLATTGSDPDTTIQMDFGGTEVPIKDPKLKAMLVMNLIQQATMVLDALSNKGQDMLQALGTPHDLALNNIRYLETAIGEFRDVLRKAAEIAG